MSQALLASAVSSLRRAATATALEPGDRQLLQDFLSQGDQTAFALLVRRYGPLVQGLCRRVLLHEQDAEDAFQATFLVLARKAATIHKGEALASWLHGVSYRIAMRAKRDAGRRRKHEQKIRTRPASAAAEDEVSWREVQAALDEEVERLPAACRAAFVLCCLQGLSQADAARHLGVKEGTVSCQLTGARKRLRAALARRGITLSAVLAGLALTDGARAAVPASAARATARCAARFAAGDMVDGLSTKAVTLAEGALTIMFTTRCTLATLLLLVTGLAGTLVFALQRQTAAATEASSGVEKSAKPPTAAKDKGDVVKVKGRVLDPDGRPVKGAKLFLAPRTAEAQKGRRQLAVSDEAGKFEATLSMAKPVRDKVLVAMAPGLAPDWIGGWELTGKKELTLRLVKDDQPINGRLLDLEGRPLANITVDVRWVGKAPGDDAGKWIERFVGMHKKGYWINEDRLLITRPAALGVPSSATTDKDGRFTLRGLGRDRIATVFLRSERTAMMRLQVAGRPGPKDGWVRGEHGLYGSPFTFLLPPSKPIFGTVRDKKTGKPIAGVKIASGNWIDETITDAQGRYRLIGVAKQRSYTLTLGGRKGVPYLGYTRFDITDTPGLEPLKVDFELERGLEISGKVLDKLTGKPVRGSVMYFITRDNPFVGNYKTLGGPKLIVERWGDIGPDGSFTVLGIPGPGVLVVLAGDSALYPRIDSRDALGKLGVNGWPSAPAHLAVKIDPREDNPKSQTCGVLALVQGVRRPGTLTDPAGKPLTGVRVVGLNDDGSPQTLSGSTFMATGLNPKQERALVFLHEGKKLGAVVGVRAAGANALTVKLRPLGAVKGRLLDADGKPLGNLRVVLRLSLDSKRFANLPEEYDRLSGAFSIHPGSWRNFTGREATTDKEGRFRVEGLIPGEQYDLFGGPGDIDRKGGVTHRAPRLTVTPAQEKDLGDLKQPDRP